MKLRWKSAFFILLTIMIIVPVIVVSLIFVNNNDLDKASKQEPKQGKPIFNIESSKEQLNFLISEQLTDLKSGRNSKFDYDVKLKDTVQVSGYFTFFSNQVDFTMDFEPQVLDNGNLILKEESIKLGALKLPGEKILEFIKGSTKLPPWVEINDNEETILVKLTEYKFQDQLFLKAESFDLEKDDIRFKVYYITE
ncbi:YpmS family protein [Pseudalkalibacillus berkeleyi]|uniref:YpmS family protein n=1 Tax=Pseudalkalibacillus berkeleyi TaxID=1069813 RepID=A0ABS9GTK6_9BACL|nr:YpmS family protein [Pseudalkalibacillus berkeleyi]MCF6136174.1 YpmS family protein [Pseudalkalibacillus berkeleyi]